MKPIAQSPFAALTPQEQKEQWICWQAAQADHQSAQEHSLPELALPKCEPPRPVPPVPQVRHSQYDAVIRRMKQARQCARQDQNWP